MTDDRTAKLIAAYRLTPNLRFVGQQFGLSKARVHQLLKAEGVNMRPSATAQSRTCPCGRSFLYVEGRQKPDRRGSWINARWDREWCSATCERAEKGK